MLNEDIEARTAELERELGVPATLPPASGDSKPNWLPTASWPEAASGGQRFPLARFSSRIPAWIVLRESPAAWATKDTPDHSLR